MQESFKQMQHNQFRIRVQGRENSDVLALLRFDWPMAKEVLDKLVAFLRAFSRHDSDAKAQQIVERALSVYRQTVFHENLEKHPDPVRISRFIDSIITETCDVVQSEQGEAFASDPQTWKEKTTALRFSLYELLTSDRMKNVLRESKHEETILAGRMAARD